MAAILNFLILRVISYFDSVDPVLNRFSMLLTPYMQIFMLSSESAHLFGISTQLLGPTSENMSIARPTVALKAAL